MNLASLVFSELRYRRMAALLTVLAVAVAVAVTVAFTTTARASAQETRRRMRDLGHNLRILPAGTDLERFWSTGYAEGTLPADALARFAGRSDLSYNHLIPFLHRRRVWRGTEWIISGVAAEISPRSARPDPMMFEIERGTLYAGSEVARRTGLERGQKVDFFGRRLEVAQVLPETGSDDDVRIYLHLEDAQDVLGLPGHINEIKALNCLCLDPNLDPLEALRAQLATILPGAIVLQHKSLADARAGQRESVEATWRFLAPAVVLGCAGLIVLLIVLNVRERTREIGVLRALGQTGGAIAALVLLRAGSLGVVGAAFGAALGAWLAAVAGPKLFPVTTASLSPAWDLIATALLCAPLATVLAAAAPAALAVAQDPADALRDD